MTEPSDVGAGAGGGVPPGAGGPAVPPGAGGPAVPPGAHLLVCGGAGFIGSCYVRDVLGRRDGTRITVLDKLTYAGNRANLTPVEGDPEQAARFAFVQGDIADPAAVDPLVAAADAVVDFAAESHVDRSILDPSAFLVTGVIGVRVLLEAVRRQTDLARAGERHDADGRSMGAPRFLQVSTDEVYGSVEEGSSREGDPLAPRSPYAAAKAAGDLLVGAYRATHDLDVVITRGANTYGPYQHPEKLIPLVATNAIDEEPIPLYGDGLQRRDWLHVADHAAAIDLALRHGAPGGVYNVPGGTERANRDVVAGILARLGRPWSLVRSVPDRPGHDRRYAMDGGRIAALGWRPRVLFEAGLAATVDWYRDNEAWWRAVRDSAWDAYYARQYGDRLAASTEAERPA
ncbi:MAG: dTDP-glucose 4,6-dehydratase [Chloroflexi bacterium]|nr:dTDP-glucose 4,6-dehydratase [Chloroflexota bacterium]